jgi:diguanylate cyclase (GGDEF)-like protein/PAS domain S-box-containing protein
VAVAEKPFMPFARQIEAYRGRYPGINIAIAAFCLVLIGLIWAAIAQRTQFERNEAIENATKENSNLVMAFEEQTVRTLRAAEQVARFVRHEYASRGARMNLPRYIENRVINENAFTIISVVDERGDVVVSNRRTGTVNYADRRFFTFHQERKDDALYISAPLLGRVSHTWQIPMSIRVDKPDGSFGGVIVLSVDPAYLAGFYQKADLGQQAVVSLVGLDGITRARKAGPRDSEGEDIGQSEVFAARARNAVGSFAGPDALDGIRRIYSYRTLKEYPLFAMVGTAETEVLEPFRQRERRYYIVRILATALILAFGLSLMSVLARQRRVVEALASSEARFRATFNQAAMGIAHAALDGRFLRANQKMCDLLGYTEQELLKRTILDITDPADLGEASRFHEQLLTDRTQSFTPEIEKRYLRKDGSSIWVCVAFGLVRDAKGNPDYLVTVTQDISRGKEVQERMVHQAYHDSLTKLPNRRLCYDRLREALAQAKPRGGIVGFLYMDVDGFKRVNDTLGHAAGDELLRQISVRLTQCVRGEDTVGRLGGDEFAIVLAEVAKVEDCGLVARKVVEALARPFLLENEAVRVSASVGVATYPEDGAEPAVMVQRADRAMFHAKHTGKNNYSFYANAEAAKPRPEQTPLSSRRSDRGATQNSAKA